MHDTVMSPEMEYAKAIIIDLNPFETTLPLKPNTWSESRRHGSLSSVELHVTGGCLVGRLPKNSPYPRQRIVQSNVLKVNTVLLDLVT